MHWIVDYLKHWKNIKLFIYKIIIKITLINVSIAIDEVYAYLINVEKGGLGKKYEDDASNSKATSIMPFGDYIRLIQGSERFKTHSQTPTDCLKYSLIQISLIFNLRSGSEYRLLLREHFTLMQDMQIQIKPPFMTKNNNATSSSYVLCYILKKYIYDMPHRYRKPVYIAYNCECYTSFLSMVTTRPERAPAAFFLKARDYWKAKSFYIKHCIIYQLYMYTYLYR